MNWLQRIAAQRRRDLFAKRKSPSLRMLERMIGRRQEYRSLAAALRGSAPAIIAEIKRRSPAFGTIDAVSDQAEIAAAYQRGGAAAISVLTEPRWFGGSFEDLTVVRSRVEVPVLCKDFIVDKRQIYMAVAYGADAVLLILSILDDPTLLDFLAEASALSLEVLVEVHRPEEARRAAAAGVGLVGINNRDLTTLVVDRGVAPRLRALLPADRIVIGESGYTRAEHLRDAMDAGLRAFLIGESLMRSPDRERRLRELREAATCSG